MITKPRNSIPTYRLNRRTGRAVVTVRNADGSRRDILLSGPFDSQESLQEYEHLLAHLRVQGACLLDRRGNGGTLTIAELMVKFMAERVIPYYVDPITKELIREQGNFKVSLRPL
jgi:hypothetical protein